MACMDGLPYFQLLRQRHIHVAYQCVFCKEPNENIAHALFFCPHVWGCWSSFLPATSEVKQRSNFLDLVLWISNCNNVDLFTKFFIICWSLQGSHNKIYTDTSLDLRASIEGALSYYTFFTTCRKAPINTLQQISCWQPPLRDSFKLNINGALFYDCRAVDIRAIICDMVKVKWS